jgi:hypothetical protein
MNYYFDKILTELSYRTQSGIIDLLNETHLDILSDILKEHNWSQEAVSLLLGELSILERKVPDDEMIPYRDAKQKARKMVASSAKVQPDDHPAKIAYNKLVGKKTNKATDADSKPSAIKKKDVSGQDTPSGKSPADVDIKAKNIKSLLDTPETGSDAANKKTNAKVKMASPERILGGRNKTLRKVDTLKTPEFLKGIEPDDAAFELKNANFKNPIPPAPYKFPKQLLTSAKFPRKYITALQRLVNTKNVEETEAWGHFSSIPGGQGAISAQLGELMTMIGTTMDNKNFEIFKQSLLDYESELVKSNPILKPDGKRIITKSWIKAADGNRKAIFNTIGRIYPGCTVMASSWDTKDDAESLGLSGYAKNKAESTDVFLKLKLPNGDEILHEVSLKKDTNVNFANGGAGSFKIWDPNIPDSINQNVYSNKQRDILYQAGSKLKLDAARLLTSASSAAQILKKLFKSKNLTFDEALSKLAAGKGSRHSNKIVHAVLQELANSGNKTALTTINKLNTMNKEFVKNAIDAISTNPKLKEGMLKSIADRFPLKNISSGEETMAIGDLSLDRVIMKDIFGTDNFSTITQGLLAKPGPPPFLAYKAKTGDKLIPLAIITIREDGVRYGGQFKFDQRLDPRFAVLLKESNSKIYK